MIFCWFLLFLVCFNFKDLNYTFFEDLDVIAIIGSVMGGVEEGMLGSRSWNIRL